MAVILTSPLKYKGQTALNFKKQPLNKYVGYVVYIMNVSIYF